MTSGAAARVNASDMPNPREAVEAAIGANRRHDDPSIWISLRTDTDLREEAARLAAEGPRGRPLWGSVFAVKDNIDVAGLPTTASCPAYAYRPEKTAPCVARLVAAGAILMGKTNLDQFATGLVGTRSPYGVPRNVFSPAHVPGGSSSGSGVAVAAGIVRFALGTDTAGSGRVPAAFGQIVGFKPTQGIIPTDCIVPACRSLDVVSVFAPSVDEALVLARIAADPEACLMRAALPPVWRLGVADIAGLCTDAVADAYARACALAPAKQEVDIAPLLEIGRLLYEGPWVAERTEAFRALLESAPDLIHPTTRAILREGYKRSVLDAFRAFHLLAEVRAHLVQLFTEIDALLLPTTPFCPTLAEDEADPFGPNARLGTFTNFVNLCGLAAIAVPAGIGADGLPIGVTVIGPARSEPRLVPIADLLHRQLCGSFGMARTPLAPSAPPDALASEEVTLFCVGAHMAGLACNSGLLRLGARFLADARTKPRYRLFDLGARPGLLRDDGGAAIAGELWALPKAALGTLLATLAPPLGLGTVQLESGLAIGFLVESAGLRNAPEITRFGGWRAYLAGK
ncbi:MAG TPA: allophanate hydrolase [Acetobacteraceae bacterium]|nr:allophanate hydrolase [Acetobacteraceae bacterium]